MSTYSITPFLPTLLRCDCDTNGQSAYGKTAAFILFGLSPQHVSEPQHKSVYVYRKGPFLNGVFSQTGVCYLDVDLTWAGMKDVVRDSRNLLKDEFMGSERTEENMFFFKDDPKVWSNRQILI